MQGSIVCSRSRKVAAVRTVMPDGSVIRGHVNRVGSDGNGIREVHLLPTRGALSREGSGGQQCTRAAPKMTHVRTRVVHTLIKANATDVAAHVRLKRDSQLHRRVRSIIRNHRRRRARPNRLLRRSSRCEDHVYPVVCRLGAISGKNRSVPIHVDSVGSAVSVGQSMQRSIVESFGRKITPVSTPMPLRVVRSYVNCVGSDGYRTREIHLLPAGGGLPCKGG